MLTQGGAPAVLTRLVVRHAQPVFSEASFAELRERLWRPKFDRYVAMEQRKALLLDLEAIAHWVEIPAAISAAKFCRDQADDKFIHAALAGEASLLVIGDQDLLVLSDRLLPAGLRIVAPAIALALPEFSSTPKP